MPEAVTVRPARFVSQKPDRSGARRALLMETD
jgi:hypothetical protein